MKCRIGGGWGEGINEREAKKCPDFLKPGTTEESKISFFNFFIFKNNKITSKGSKSEKNWPLSYFCKTSISKMKTEFSLNFNISLPNRT